mgnify:CR=1 FL=1
MLRASISASLAKPSPNNTEEWLCNSPKNRFLACGESCLLSFNPTGQASLGKIQAAATTGPARGPRPASSTPATRKYPFCQAASSKQKEPTLRRGTLCHRRSSRSGFSCRILIRCGFLPFLVLRIALFDVCHGADATGYKADNAPSISVGRNNGASAAASLDDLALDAMQRALARHRGNLSAAARELGVSRNTLYRKLPKDLLRPAAPEADGAGARRTAAPQRGR